MFFGNEICLAGYHAFSQFMKLRLIELIGKAEDGVLHDQILPGMGDEGPLF